MAPRAETLLLTTLLKFRQRCPECGQLDISELSASTAADRIGRSVRIPAALYARLQAEAGRQVRTVNNLIIYYAERGLEQDERGREQ